MAVSKCRRSIFLESKARGFKNFPLYGFRSVWHTYRLIVHASKLSGKEMSHDLMIHATISFYRLVEQVSVVKHVSLVSRPGSIVHFE